MVEDVRNGDEGEEICAFNLANAVAGSISVLPDTAEAIVKTITLVPLTDNFCTREREIPRLVAKSACTAAKNDAESAAESAERSFLNLSDVCTAADSGATPLMETLPIVELTLVTPAPVVAVIFTNTVEPKENPDNTVDVAGAEMEYDFTLVAKPTSVDAVMVYEAIGLRDDAVGAIHDTETDVGAPGAILTLRLEGAEGTSVAVDVPK